MAEVGILVVDDDAANQRALKSVLDSEGWRVRIVQDAPQAMAEMATGQWSLAIVNVALADVKGPLYAILRDLSQAAADAPVGDGALPHKAFRVLFLVPPSAAPEAQPLLEREGLPYSLQPYHLHDFLEKVSDLLVEAGAIAQPIRNISAPFGAGHRRRSPRSSRETKHKMFAARDDYQMTEEELAEFERLEEEERKKRLKRLRDQEHL